MRRIWSSRIKTKLGGRMTINEHDQLVEWLGIEPETEIEKYLFNKLWEYMDKKTKAKIKAIEL